jgi:hypothetical protein
VGQRTVLGHHNLPAIPADGTIVRTAGSTAVLRIVNGSKQYLTLAEWQALGSPAPTTRHRSLSRDHPERMT